MNAKRFQLALFIGLLFTVLASFFSFESNCQEIRKNVLRLHILANSDSESDQALKLKVRDRLVLEGAGLFDEVMTEQQAAAKAKESLSMLQSAAEDEIKKQGYSYPVKVEVAKTYFNTRHYETVTLPAGEYEAVRVLIGKAEGHNWWCVMFPSMCLPAASESKKLDQVLGDDEMDIVQDEVKYEFRFKTVELFEDLKQGLSKLF